MKTTRNLKLKNGTTIPAGTVCTVTFNRSPVCTVQPEGFNPCRLRCSSLPVYLADDFSRPTLDELGAVIDDSVCASVMGEPVEPDGYDQHGSPSWLLALGLI
jgi:hypothetical protein